MAAGPSISRNRNDPYLGIIKHLSLEAYYPSRITLTDALTIRKLPDQPVLADVPWMLINRLLMIDSRGPDQLLSGVGKSAFARSEEEPEADPKQKNVKLKRDDKVPHTKKGLGNFLGKSKSVNRTIRLSTLDMVVAVFLCCDNFLKQVLVEKMFLCKLAIPFMMPLGYGGRTLMSIWALRTLTVPCRSPKISEISVLDGELPVVTFVRIGKPFLSKSKLLNDVVNDRAHCTFFNRDSANGRVSREVTNGLVECAWFIEGKTGGTLTSTTMFLNLRGDALEMTKQLNFLQTISSVVFVMTNARDLGKSPNAKACQQLLRGNAKIVLFVVDEPKPEDPDDVIRERKECVKAVGRNLMDKAYLILSTDDDGDQKNTSELKDEVRSMLNQIVPASGNKLVPTNKLAKSFSITKDECDNACTEGIKLAKVVLSEMKNKPISDCKDDLLPLQGPEWNEYCRLNKVFNRSHNNDDSNASTSPQTKLGKCREKHIKHCKSGRNKFTMKFISTLQKIVDTHNTDNMKVVLYFLKWIKIALNEKSKTSLPGLRMEYHRQREIYKKAKGETSEAIERLEQNIDKAESDLAKASMGLENIFREIGQMYEAVKQSGHEVSGVNVESLPQIAAKLLLEGIPLELMDGDASGVPLTWIKTVLQSLVSIIGDKKIFVVSVLGIQSSGKSTLLNGMFGLQFAVSAGRCTRGAFMQLIPVDVHSGLPFSYIAVIDTEGLRAQELATRKYQQDNELATFVIGLGDVTILNIKGENTAEIKDVLQIAVHAFLRMKHVNKHIVDQRTCLFVHQNAAAVGAADVMLPECHKLHDILDKMTKEAASSEKISDIHSFSQIIRFDVTKHIWYFPDLWLGDPPMAPTNNGYSEMLGSVKHYLLEDLARKNGTYLKVSDFAVRLSDIWNGVLAENFVFSFRNTLEMKAYNNMQSEYYDCEWQFITSMNEWLQEAELKLSTCGSVDELSHDFSELDDSLPGVFKSGTEEAKKQLNTFFEIDDYKGIINQWKQFKSNSLDLVMKQQLQNSKSELFLMREARRVELMQTETKSKYEEDIMKRARDLADRLRGREASDADIEEEFNRMWVPIITKIGATHEDKMFSIKLHMQHILMERFQSHSTILNKELSKNRLDTPFPDTCLLGSIKLAHIKEGEHFSMTRRFRNYLKPEISQEEGKQAVLKLTNEVFDDVTVYIANLGPSARVKEIHCNDVIVKLANKIDIASANEKRPFQIMPAYTVKLAVLVSHYCIGKFTKMQRLYNEKYSMKAKVAQFKDTTLSLVRNSVKQSTEEVMAGELFCSQLKQLVEDAVKKRVPNACINGVLMDIQLTKYNLIKKIMKDLAKKDFDDNESYVTDAKTYALKWIIQYTKNKYFRTSTEVSQKSAMCGDLVRNYIQEIIDCIRKGIRVATEYTEEQATPSITGWVTTFCETVSVTIAVPTIHLKHVSDRNVEDFNNMERIIVDLLKCYETSLLESFFIIQSDVDEWIDTHVAQEIMSRIWGCHEMCPFCNEPCADTTRDHYSEDSQDPIIYHMCVQHRPKGIAGVCWNKDTTQGGRKIRKDQLSHDTCNYSINQTDVTFTCSACKFQCRNNGCGTTGSDVVSHSYSEYRKYLPGWDIAPKPTNDTSKYWMWFMAKYEQQLKEVHNAELPSIPDYWYKITEKEALDDLEVLHR